MTVYNESGLSLTLPMGQHFRFADLPAYAPLSGQHLKEMDFAWIDGAKLILLEVRSYAQMTNPLRGADFVPVKGAAAPHRFATLVEKMTDSLLMLLAAWAGTERGALIGADLPIAARSRIPLKLVVAVDLSATLAVHLPALRDKLNERIRARLALADVASVVLLDYARLLAHPLFSGRIVAQP